MYKKIFIICITLGLFLFFHNPIRAFYDPTTVPNNKFGIHLADTNDLPEVPSLVNTNGGDWGYVTVVIQDNDRDQGKWQAVFNDMRRVHLIPIVRLATHLQGNYWTMPDNNSIDDWVNFLIKLNWPIANRYVILFNEPNHANEWGNSLDPEGYAKFYLEFAKRLKTSSPDYFIMPAGLDASASNDGIALDESEYLKRVIQNQPDILNFFDGWSSHSYPNPGFSGSPYASGKGTLRSYQWEIAYLKSLGLNKDLPVFITETGWEHAEGKNYDRTLLTSFAVANYFSIAAGIWSDPGIIAVTPFVYNYQDVPFDHFSWKTISGNDFYPQFAAYQAIAKTKGEPKQHYDFTISQSVIPDQLVTDSTYTFSFAVQNQGQSIINKNDYSLKFQAVNRYDFIAEPLPIIEPGQTGNVTIHLHTGSITGKDQIKLFFSHNQDEIVVSQKEITLIPPPSLKIKLQLGWRRNNNASDITVLVYKDKELIHKITGLKSVGGEVIAAGLSDTIPGQKYRIVVLVPSYLPRQSIITLTSLENLFAMKRFYPLDFDHDGKLSINDFWMMIRLSPFSVIRLIFRI